MRSGGFLSDIECLIIGGGLVGSATAWHLASAGGRVVLLEQGQLGSGASGQNAGSLHFQIERRFLERPDGLGEEGERTAALSRIAIDDWRGLESRLGTSLHVHMKGGLMVAETREELALLERKAESERAAGLSVETIDGDAARRRAPYLSPTILAANYMADEGHADTRIVAPAFARAAAAAGASIRTDARVLALEGDGTGFDIVVEQGSGTERLRARQVLIAAGAWSARIAALANLHLPLFPVALTMSASECTPMSVPHLVQHVGRRLSLKQTHAGNLLIGGGWPSLLRRDAQGFDLSRPPTLIQQSLHGNLAAAVDVVPQVASLSLIRTWTGITAVTADQLPVVGEFPAMPGLFCAAGGSAFTLGPTFARLTADLMLDRNRREAEQLLAVASPARFGGVNGFMGRR